MTEQLHSKKPVTPWGNESKAHNIQAGNAAGQKQPLAELTSEVVGAETIAFKLVISCWINFSSS